MSIKRLVLGGGCFWCTEAVFGDIKGVKNVISGYTGGRRPNPTYDNICSGVSGHAEIIDIKYDSDIISFKDLLRVFFTTHNPTTLNAQGADKGTQYRSVIYYNNEQEKEIIEHSINKAQKNFCDKIVTEVSQLGVVYQAEDYHQNYYKSNSNQGYCQVVIKPKVEKVMIELPELLN